MQQLSDDKLRKLCGDVFVDELKAIYEHLEDIPIIKRDIGELKEAVSELKTDMKAVKALLKDRSKRLIVTASA